MISQNFKAALQDVREKGECYEIEIFANFFFNSSENALDETIFE